MSKLKTTCLASFLLLALPSCAEVQSSFKAFEDQGVKATQNVNDDAVDLWAKSACGLTYGGLQRNPSAGRVVPFLCGKLPDGTELPPAALAPIAAPPVAVRTGPAS